MAGSFRSERDNICKSENTLIVRKRAEERPAILIEYHYRDPSFLSFVSTLSVFISAMQNSRPRQFAQVSTELRISKAVLSIHQGRRAAWISFEVVAVSLKLIGVNRRDPGVDSSLRVGAKLKPSLSYRCHSVIERAYFWNKFRRNWRIKILWMETWKLARLTD